MGEKPGCCLLPCHPIPLGEDTPAVGGAILTPRHQPPEQVGLKTQVSLSLVLGDFPQGSQCSVI